MGQKRLLLGVQSLCTRNTLNSALGVNVFMGSIASCFGKYGPNRDNRDGQVVLDKAS
jgi:hypothetical protein